MVRFRETFVRRACALIEWDRLSPVRENGGETERGRDATGALIPDSLCRACHAEECRRNAYKPLLIALFVAFAYPYTNKVVATPRAGDTADGVPAYYARAVHAVRCFVKPRACVFSTGWQDAFSARHVTSHLSSLHSRTIITGQCTVRGNWNY